MARTNDLQKLSTIQTILKTLFESPTRGNHGKNPPLAASMSVRELANALDITVQTFYRFMDKPQLKHLIEAYGIEKLSDPAINETRYVYNPMVAQIPEGTIGFVSEPDRPELRNVPAGIGLTTLDQLVLHSWHISYERLVKNNEGKGVSKDQLDTDIMKALATDNPTYNIILSPIKNKTENKSENKTEVEFTSEKISKEDQEWALYNVLIKRIEATHAASMVTVGIYKGVITQEDIETALTFRDKPELNEQRFKFAKEIAERIEAAGITEEYVNKLIEENSNAS